MTERTAEVWWLETGALDAAGVDRLEGLLDREEQARSRRFRFDRDRRGYVAAHALGRCLLSRRAGGAPRSWTFAAGPHGKPEVVGPSGRPRLRLNLSHTRGLAAAALTDEHDIGIDVEWLGRRDVGEDLARRFFAPAERAAIAATPPDRMTETFLSFWTLKEAYIKATGLGLSQALDAFAFTLEPLSIRFEPDIADDPSLWRFARMRPTPDHLLALAIRHLAPETVPVTATAVDVATLLAYSGGEAAAWAAPTPA